MSLKKYKKKQYLLLGICIAIVVMLVVSGIIEISVSNSLTTEGIKLGKIQAKIDAVKKDNMLLKEKLLTMSSYAHIASEAATLGFVDAKSAIFLDQPIPLAVKQ